MSEITNNDRGSDFLCGYCETPLPTSRTKPRKWCSDKCRMRARRVLEDLLLAEWCKFNMMTDNIFTDREIANRVRLLARNAIEEEHRDFFSKVVAEMKP